MIELSTTECNVVTKIAVACCFLLAISGLFGIASSNDKPTNSPLSMAFFKSEKVKLTRGVPQWRRFDEMR